LSVRTTDTFHTDTKQQVKLWFYLHLFLDFQNLPVLYKNTSSLAISKNDTNIIVALARKKIFFFPTALMYNYFQKKGGGGGRESQEFPSAIVMLINARTHSTFG
jgi:hypothetical protein